MKYFNKFKYDSEKFVTINNEIKLLFPQNILGIKKKKHLGDKRSNLPVQYTVQPKDSDDQTVSHNYYRWSSVSIEEACRACKYHNTWP